MEENKKVYVINNLDTYTCRIVNLTESQYKAIKYVFDEFDGADISSLDICKMEDVVGENII